MGLLDHLSVFRKHLIISLVALAIASAVAFVLYEPIIELLYRPLAALETMGEGSVLYVNTILEGFATRLKVSVLAGLVLSLPVHLLSAVRFTFPGLRPREKRVIVAALLSSFVFIVLSFLYSYYTIIPVSVAFLTSGRFIPRRIGMLLSFGKNIFTILQFILVALILFQIPILLEMLLIMKVITRKALLRFGRYVVVGFFVLAAIVTPPDFVTQLAIALPLTALYYLAVLIARVFRFGEG